MNADVEGMLNTKKKMDLIDRLVFVFSVVL